MGKKHKKKRKKPAAQGPAAQKPTEAGSNAESPGYEPKPRWHLTWKKASAIIVVFGFAYMLWEMFFTDPAQTLDIEKSTTAVASNADSNTQSILEGQGHVRDSLATAASQQLEIGMETLQRLEALRRAQLDDWIQDYPIGWAVVYSGWHDSRPQVPFKEWYYSGLTIDFDDLRIVWIDSTAYLRQPRIVQEYEEGGSWNSYSNLSDIPSEVGDSVILVEIQSVRVIARLLEKDELGLTMLVGCRDMLTNDGRPLDADN